MNDDLVICAEGLGKRYWVGHETEREQYVALRDVLARTARNTWRKTRDLARGRDIVVGDTVEEFWALRDLSFEVRRGEVLGIIGRNGAGKSTLLKILSRITEPSEGRVTIKGRVASLLEVGTGFHPELTGRENIFLNGAILGMSRTEIKRKFDAIVAFAEVEKFLDTPVKRYSSGMYVRLAFAVAAHLEPEILIVDEVLAVGDTEFQQKCLGKMGEVAEGGRTILFVSHDMRRLSAICERGLLLNEGRIECAGPMSLIVDRYLAQQSITSPMNDLTVRKDRTGLGGAIFTSIELFQDGHPSSTLQFGRQFTIRVGVRVVGATGPLFLQAGVLTVERVPVQEFFTLNDGIAWKPTASDFFITIDVDSVRLYPGRYTIDLWLGAAGMARIDYVTQALAFDVFQPNNHVARNPLDKSNGLFFQTARWTISDIASGRSIVPADHSVTH
jgi:lipopolysaccharide transport system ATP-binding protein